MCQNQSTLWRELDFKEPEAMGNLPDFLQAGLVIQPRAPP